MDETIDQLIRRKEKEKNIDVFERAFDAMGNLHILCRNETGTYTVYTAYRTKKATYEKLYLGKTFLSLTKAIDEYTKRVKYLG